VNKKILALIAAGLFATPMLASAIPIQYDVTYSATAGSNGIGSFIFDQDDGLMSGFNWNFGGILGGLSDFSFTSPRPAGLDTRGRLIFEILSHTDVYSSSDCTRGGCTSSSTIGAVPNLQKLTLRNTAFDASYEFERQGALVSAGLVSIAPRSVPEPSVLMLLVLALLASFTIRFSAKRST
jgi:hypothetical protein